MKMRAPFFLLSLSIVALPICAVADSKTHNPTWWDKYEFMKNNGPDPSAGSTISLNFNGNIDISNECGPQSETFIALNPEQPKMLAAGSNEIFRLPMRGYFSSNGGTSWGGVDLPLPPPQGTNGVDFGSDPALAFDTRGNVFYSYIVVFFGNGNGVNGSEMAVAHSTDGGQTYPSVTFFGFEGGSSHFNDKPMITTDKNPSSAFRDNVYVAWDAAAGGSTGGGIRVGTSTDQTVRIAGVCIARGWTRLRPARPTFIFPIRTTTARTGRRAPRSPINCRSWSIGSITGCRSIPLPAT